MENENKLSTIGEGKKSFRSNRFIIGLQLEDGKRFRWPLHALREWTLTPSKGKGVLKVHQELVILIGSYEIVVKGSSLEHIDEVFCEGSGGDIIERGPRYLEVSQAKPFVAKIEIRDTGSHGEF